MTPRFQVLLLSAAAVATLGLVGCAGSASAVSITGVWGQADAPGEPSLQFQEDGSYSGTDGCNRLMGSWTLDGDTVDLGEMASTMMYCEDVDDWLNQGVTATIDGDTLVVRGAGGTEIGTLDRK